MSLSTINAFNYLLKTALNLNENIPELKSPRDYLKILNMLKRLESKEKCKIRLLIIIFEEMFMKNSNIILTKNTVKINAFITYCKVHLIPEKIKTNSEFKIISRIFKTFELGEDELLLIYYLMINNKKPSLYYKIIDAILSTKKNNYITNDKIRISDNIDYVKFVECVINTYIKYGKKNCHYFMFDYDNNEFKIRTLSKEEIELYKISNNQLKSLYRKEIIEFINDNYKSINSDINNIEEEKKSNKDKEIQNKDKNISSTIKNEKSQSQKIETNKINEKEKLILNNTEISFNENKLIKELNSTNKEIIDLKQEIILLKNYNNIAEKKITILNSEIVELKNYKNNAKKEISILNGKIGELNNYKKGSEQRESIKNREIAELKDYKISLENEIIKLKESLLSMKKDSERKEANFNKKIEQLKENNANSVKTLLKNINDIKTANNDLNLKLSGSEKKKENLENELLFLKSNSEIIIGKLTKELEKIKASKDDINKEIKMIQKRDTDKFLIDFFYSIFFKKYDHSKKYEEKVGDVCKAINQLKNKENVDLLDKLNIYLNKIKDEKIKGDKLAHPELIYPISTGYKNVDNFLIYFLEIQKYFFDFKRIYQTKNRNEKSFNEKINNAIKSIEGIDFNYIVNSFH